MKEKISFSQRSRMKTCCISPFTRKDARTIIYKLYLYLQILGQSKWHLVCKSHFWNIDFKLLIIIIDAFLLFKFTFLILLPVY